MKHYDNNGTEFNDPVEPAIHAELLSEIRAIVRDEIAMALMLFLYDESDDGTN
jgi:hypothetical protein